mgnify:CR=1 FL=1
MIVKRGEIWMADLNPIRGSEQAGARPVVIFQNDVISKFTTTVLSIPLSTNIRRASLPSCIRISKGDGGLTNDSVALCHQLRVLDKIRLQRRMWAVAYNTLTSIEDCILFTMGIT